MKKLYALILGLTILFSPLAFAGVTYASEPIATGCNTGEIIPESKDASGNVIPAHFKNGNCDFDFAMKLINRIINFLLFVIATPLAALILCYAGFLMLTAGGSSEKVTKAKSIIKNIIFGYIIALAAWLIVHTIFSTLGFTGETFLKDY